MRIYEFIKGKKGATGIGTLIVFIAMVLVAAVAAAVLINTSGFLQQKAMATGKESTEQVASGLMCDGVTGHVFKFENTFYDIDKLALYISPNAGSAPIDLKEAKLFLTYDGKTVVLKYGGKIDATSGVDNIFNLTNELILNTSDYSGMTAVAYNNSGYRFINITGSDNVSIGILKSFYLNDTLDNLIDSSGNSSTNAKVVDIVYDPSSGNYTVVINTSDNTNVPSTATPLSWVYIDDKDAYWGGANDKQFLVVALQDADKSVVNSGVINKGDLVAILVNTQAALNATIPERSAVSGKLQPEFGAPAVIEFVTPAAYTSEIVSLQ